MHLKHGNDTAPTNWTNENVEALKDNSSEASYATANAISTTQQSIQTGVNHSIPYVDNSAHLMDHNIFTDEMVDDLAYSLFAMTKHSSSHQSSNLKYSNYLEAPAMSNNTPQASESNIFQPEHLSNLNVSDLSSNSDSESAPTTKVEMSSTQTNPSQTSASGGAANARYFPELQGQDKTFGSETAVVGFNNLIPYPIEPISFESFFQNDSIDSGFSSMFDTKNPQKKEDLSQLKKKFGVV